MKIILRLPEEIVSGQQKAAAGMEVIPHYADRRKLSEQFQILGRQRRDCYKIALDQEGVTLEEEREAVRIMVRSLYQGAYCFRKEGLKSLLGNNIFELRDSLSDFGDGVFYLESRKAEEEEFIRAVQLGELEGKCMGYARSLGNLPPNYLGAEELCSYISSLSAFLETECLILGEEELKNGGYGGILAVNQGSAHEARLAVLRKEKTPLQPFTALIGKGILFDSGGYHLKSMKSMEGMKFDMCGAANALEAFEILIREGEDENLMVVLPLAENAIGPDACRMGDVITMGNGSTVEIYNTDAEGRLILADALIYAQQNGADRLVDLATLTYSCQAALGDRMTGLFSNDEDVCRRYEEAAHKAGELVWRLPLDSHYRELLAWSNTADIANYAPGKGAGASVAACFLETFIRDGAKWIHLDAVGPSVMREKNNRMAEGATGANIASIVTYLEKGNGYNGLYI